MRSILKVSSILSLATIFAIVTGVIKNKFLAVSIGPAGIGIVAQLSSYLNTTNTISSFGMSQGVTKYVAETCSLSNRYMHLRKILHSATMVVLSISLPLFLFTVLFSRNASALLLDNKVPHILFIIIAAAIPLQAMGHICIAFVQGLKAVKWLTATLIVTGIAGLISLFPLVVFFKTTGAVANILFFTAVNCISFFYVARHLINRELKWASGDEGSAEPAYFKRILSFGYLRLIQTAIYPLTILVIRSLIIKNLGLPSNGIYEAAIAFSFLYVPLITNILWSYTYPNYCNAKDDAALNKEVNQFLKVSLFIAVPAIACIIMLRGFFIRLLFSPEFLPAVAVMGMALIGDFLKVLIWPFNVVLMAKNRMKIAVFFEFTWNASFLILSFFLMPVYKLKGVFIIQNLSLLLILFLSYIYVHKRFSVRLTRDNLLLIIASILIIAVAGGLS